MGYKLCTAEKPSVAKDIAAVVGANTRHNGYFEGNGYIVTWAVGHLVGLDEPESYGYIDQQKMYNDEEAKLQAYNELPLIPTAFKTHVLPNTKEQFEIIKSLMHRNDVDCIIDCGDMGAEGHILQWLIRQQAGCTKPIKRFCATSMTEEAIREAMNNLRDIDEFESVITGEFCKKRADWILGMSMSRCASIKYNARVDVGRVQSPTLYFVVKRYFDVVNFKETTYYTMQSEFCEGFSCAWGKDTGNKFAEQYKDKENRVLNRAAVEAAAQSTKACQTGIISKLEKNKRGTDRPKLYDITELERDGIRIFGYSADGVLATAQSLYETHKVLSYPRTDSRYITSDLEPYMQERIKAIGEIEKYSKVANVVLQRGLNIDKKIVDDSKVTDHHALIVTEKINGFDFDKLVPTKEEAKKGVTAESLKNILHLVITRMLVAFSRKYIYEETNILVSFNNGFEFTANGRIPIDYGWKNIQKASMGKENCPHGEDETINFPPLVQGQTVTLSKVAVLEKKTTAPKLHTEDTLLTAMENAGAVLENGAILKGRGIGTQATRANIIKSLFDKDYVVYSKKGKTNYLLPTKQGINTIKVIPSDLYSPAVTADWETKIAGIVEGIYSEDKFMNEFTDFINKKVNEVKQTTISNLDFKREKETMGKCPWCGSDVYKGTITSRAEKKVDSYYCSNKDCKFSINADNILFYSRTRKNLTEVQVKKLLTGKAFSCKCIGNSSGKVYNGIFKLNKKPNAKGYADITFEFGKKQ